MDAFQDSANRFAKEQQAKLRTNHKNSGTTQQQQNRRQRLPMATTNNTTRFQQQQQLLPVGNYQQQQRSSTSTSRVGMNGGNGGGGGIVGIGNNNNNNNNNKRIIVSDKVRHEMELNKQRQQQIMNDKKRKKRILQLQEEYIKKCENHFGIEPLSLRHPTLQLIATSIHGDGDKISLPPSVLEYLMSANSISAMDDTTNSSPWYFRIGIRNPHYNNDNDNNTNANTNTNNDSNNKNMSITFPASPILQAMFQGNEMSKNNTNDNDNHHGSNDQSDSDSDDDDDHDDCNPMQTKESSQNYYDAYLDEIQHQYISFTHGTVIEFTQEEGYVGLPQPVCDALLRNNQNQTHTNDNNNSNSKKEEGGSTLLIPVTRTVDPAKNAINKEWNKEMDDKDDDISVEDDGDDNEPMQVDGGIGNEDEPGTPGHVAYGAFDVPAVPIEITLLRKLPRGKACTLVPSMDAIQNGFYQLKDMKLVLEQSLITTRATLSVHDTIRTWHRGKQYNLSVEKVTPSHYCAISCINTDIEIEFGEVQQQVPTAVSAVIAPSNTTKSLISNGGGGGGSGYTLGGGSSMVSGGVTTNQRYGTTDVLIPLMSSSPCTLFYDMLPEPPMDQITNVVTIQIRGLVNIHNTATTTTTSKVGGSGPRPAKRRFDITVATVQDLFHFALTCMVMTSHPDNQDDNHKNQSPINPNHEMMKSTSTTIVPQFQLVTTYPRRVITYESHSSATSTLLQQIPIQPGQELFLVEYL